MPREALPVALSLLLAGCVAHRTPVNVYLSGQRDVALQDQRERAAVASREQALEQARLASMALALGDDALAEAALRQAVGRMTTFQADGEFAAVLGAEDNKEWKGEPYEKMAAFLTLGALLHAEGDRGNALAMYKSAVLADTGTAEERYRSDFVPAWVLQALAYQAEGEPENAAEAMRRGVDARTSRYLLQALSEQLQRASAPALSEDIDLARAALYAALPAGVTAAPRDPAAAARAAASLAGDLLRVQRDKPSRERLDTFQGWREDHFDRALSALGPVAADWQARVAALPADLLAEDAAFDAQMQRLLADPPNVVLLIERGRGPRKIRAGRYGEILQIVPGGVPAGAPRVSLGGEIQRPLWLDDLAYQATTRGGRQVDGFLKGKAIFKDTSLITGRVLLEMAEAAAWNDNDQLAGALAIAGAATFVAGLATNPAADVRQWELLPGEWYLLAGAFPPGARELQVEDRTYTLNIPEKGQVVALVPRLAPGGPQVIGEP